MRHNPGPAPSFDVILDLLIIIVVAVAVFVGYKRGTVQPLLGFLGFVLTAFLFLTHWATYSAFLNEHFHSNGVIDAVVLLVVAVIVGYIGWRLGGFVHKMPIIRGIDGLLGVLVCGLVAIWLLYGLISLGTSMNKAFEGTIGTSSVTEAQAQAINRWIGGNPILRQVVTKQDRENLEKAAAKPNNPESAIDDSAFTSIYQLQVIYRHFVLPQLESSHLAPVLMWIGDHTPVIGHESARDLPRKPTPAPVVSPSASASATPTP